MASITITQREPGVVAFQPFVPCAKPGQPLGAGQGENITWNNETNDPHWPWPIDAQGKILSEDDAVNQDLYLCDDVRAGRVSKPIFQVTQSAPFTIRYVCKHHPHEQGSIVVS